MSMPDKIKETFEAAKERFSPVFTGLKDLKWEDIPDAAKERIMSTSALDATRLVAILVFFVPALLWAPVVFALGVGSGGPIAGGVFAAMQSMFGTNAVMAVLQSAGMGGAWGMGILGGLTKGAAVVAGGLAQWAKAKAKKGEAET